MTDSGIGGRGYTLAWPREALRDELTWLLSSGADDKDAEYLLTEAFTSTDPVDKLKALGGTGRHQSIVNHDCRAYLQALLGAVDDLPTAQQRARSYWAQRHGRALTATDDDLWLDPLRRLKTSWHRLVQDLLAQGHFDYTAPSDCPDEDHAPQEIVLEDEIRIRLNVPDLWPIKNEQLEQDDLFYSLIEVVGDLVARPRRRSYHNYGGCGYHYTTFSTSTGQAIYRAKVNDLLEQQRSPLCLALAGEDEGLLVHMAGDDRDELVTGVLTTPAFVDRDELRHAIAMFRAWDADRAAKRSAVVALARLLEDRRTLLKQELLSKDEGALFLIANQFDIRHRNPRQQEDYDEAFLDWIFWWYLSTIALTDKLAGR